MRPEVVPVPVADARRGCDVEDRLESVWWIEDVKRRNRV